MKNESLPDTKIEFLKGVGPQRADLLRTELGIDTFQDLLGYYPFRYEDRTQFYRIAEITEESGAVQLRGRITELRQIGAAGKERLEATLEDASGMTKLVWFKNYISIKQKINIHQEYVVYGKPQLFGRIFSIPHPEIELFNPHAASSSGLFPVYPTTEKLRRRYLDSKGIAKLQRALLPLVLAHIPEILPPDLIERYRFMARPAALRHLHFPRDEDHLQQALRRMKFEELFLIQLKLLRQKKIRTQKHHGLTFDKIPTLKDFYAHHLPFDLTDAQKRVIREIFEDVKSGQQMNRLLQGDVGSGKTIVAFIVMLMAIDNGAQSCLMAPTEILAEQHFNGLKTFADVLGIRIELLTGSTKKAARRTLHAALQAGEVAILVGTHALLEDEVQFQNLGLCVIDEQHRFGVAQRAKLWKKNPRAFPHVLVMTATPIPRTLAMTLYGDLDVSVIDQLPAGRKPIQTLHRYDAHRLRVFGFVADQIKRGRQVYIVYPLIEESEKMDLKNLEDGYESICRAFPGVPISIVHGRMHPEAKDFEMQRFVKNETKIMVATTVIEVGVNVPNATLMIIENAERFGLAQLHQLRGRVGRGDEQSYCILMSGYKLSKDGRARLKAMVETTNGFEIADLDLKLRGPGDMSGTTQSGVLDLQLADLAKDGEILKEARACAIQITDQDPELQLPQHQALLQHLQRRNQKQSISWSQIS